MPEEHLTTFLHQWHVEAGARMTSFGPWAMPLQYSSIIDEHLATRGKAGLFDTSHMGEIGLAGPGSLETLERVFTRHVEPVPPGRARYGFMTTHEGTVVDDCVLYAVPEDYAPPCYILCVNAGNTAGDLAWIKEHAAKQTVIENLSPTTGKIDIQGPLSGKIIGELAGREVALKRFEFDFMELGGALVMISRSGYTGEDGFEIFTGGGLVFSAWERMFAAGQPYGLKPAGLGARDTLRTEACLPLYGRELSGEITPVEAGFEWALCFEKEFLGKDALLRQVEEGPSMRIMPFLMGSKVPARPGNPVHCNGRKAGTVTSGTYLPSLKEAGGMCLVEREYAQEGRMVEVEIRGRSLEARLASRPLYERRSP